MTHEPWKASKDLIESIAEATSEFEFDKPWKDVGEALQIGHMGFIEHILSLSPIPLIYEALSNLENDNGDAMPPSAWKLVQDAIRAADGKPVIESDETHFYNCVQYHDQFSSLFDGQGKTTWREMILEKLTSEGENWDDIEVSVFSSDDIDRKFSRVPGFVRRIIDFTIATNKNVYYPEYDDFTLEPAVRVIPRSSFSADMRIIRAEAGNLVRVIKRDLVDQWWRLKRSIGSW